MELKERIERLMSEILSDMHDCRVTLHFVPAEGEEDEKKSIKKSA